MKLSSLNPQFWGDGSLRFDCPRCGAPYTVSIKCSAGPPDQEKAIWNWNYDGRRMNWDSLTVLPSIRFAAHGRKKSCGWHGNITRGEVTNA
jgi:hypothetical protein